MFFLPCLSLSIPLLVLSQHVLLGLYAFLDDVLFFHGEGSAVHLSEEVLAPGHTDAPMVALEEVGQAAPLRWVVRHRDQTKQVEIGRFQGRWARIEPRPDPMNRSFPNRPFRSTGQNRSTTGNRRKGDRARTHPAKSKPKPKPKPMGEREREKKWRENPNPNTNVENQSTHHTTTSNGKDGGSRNETMGQQERSQVRETRDVPTGWIGRKRQPDQRRQGKLYKRWRKKRNQSKRETRRPWNEAPTDSWEIMRKTGNRCFASRHDRAESNVAIPSDAHSVVRMHLLSWKDKRPAGLVMGETEDRLEGPTTRLPWRVEHDGR